MIWPAADGPVLGGFVIDFFWLKRRMHYDILSETISKKDQRKKQNTFYTLIVYRSVLFVCLFFRWEFELSSVLAGQRRKHNITIAIHDACYFS
jgi:hypothetical protein